MTNGAEGLHAKRWQRYGMDRIYVNDGTQKLGFLDVRTGQLTVTAAERHTDVENVIRRYLAENPSVTVASSPEPTPQPSSEQQAASRKTPQPPPFPAAPSPPPPSPAAPTATTPTATPPPTFATPAYGPPPTPTGDLAQNRAGAAAMAQAKALERDHRVLNLLARAVGIQTPSTSWRVGAKGERMVGRELDRLTRHGWMRLDAVPVGENGSDIDHVMIGPGGVFTLNTKHHPGAKVWLGENALLVNGANTPYLRNSRHEARRAARLLTAAWGFRATVVPIIVLVGITNLTIRATPADVVVQPLNRLRNFFEFLPPTQDARTVASLYEVARRPETWTGRAGGAVRG